MDSDPKLTDEEFLRYHGWKVDERGAQCVGDSHVYIRGCGTGLCACPERRTEQDRTFDPPTGLTSPQEAGRPRRGPKPKRNRIPKLGHKYVQCNDERHRDLDYCHYALGNMPIHWHWCGQPRSAHEEG